MRLWIDTARLGLAGSLFGIGALERLRRSLRPLPDLQAVELSGSGDAVWPGAQIDASSAALGERLRAALRRSAQPLVVLDGAHLTDPRLIAHLGRQQHSCVAARGEAQQRAVALCLLPAAAERIPPQAATLREVADALLDAGAATPLDETAFEAYIDKLRRVLPYWIYRVEDAGTRRRLERQLFRDNYKGSTDLLTRYVFPPLVWPLTRLCARFGIHPNTVTVLSIVLAFAAVPLWMNGAWLAGFVCAYAMAVLDSVDGKLARLTLTDSKIGNILDHGLDQVHPPFWYYAWAPGLGATAGDPLLLAAWLLIGFYVGDRIVLGIARRRLGRALHSTTSLDEWARSIVARRNILMTVMAIALLLDAGATGLWVCTIWQGLTMLWHGLRTVQLGFAAGGRIKITGRIDIVEVRTPAEMDRFIKLPSRLHAGDPHFVPPLVLERRDAFSPKKNPYFEHAEAQFFLAVRDGRDVGRISAQVDRLVQDPAIGHFGLIAAEDDAEVFAALFGAAETWLAARGRTRVLGPFNLSINEETGLLIDGFDTPPMIFMGHDARYAAGRIEAQGYAKAKDVIAYLYDIRNDLPVAARRLIDRRKPTTMTVRNLDMKRYDADFDMVREIFNDAWSRNWSYIPFTEAEFRHLAKGLKSIIDPQFVAIVEVDGKGVGFGIMLPNLNEAIRDFDGKLLPFNIVRLLWRLKRGTATGRVPLMGVRRSYGGGVLGSLVPFLIIDTMREGALRRGMKQVELSWILEDNRPMRHIIESLGSIPYKTYRVYEKALA